MSVCTTGGQTINVVSNFAGVRIVVGCSEDVCEKFEVDLSANEWLALVLQGFTALNRTGE